MKLDKSKDLFKRAERKIPGGVNSPVRSFQSIDGTPIFIKRGMGSRIIDVDDNEFIDFVCSWGPLILGHNNQILLDELKVLGENGLSFGLPTEIEVEMAELISEAIPAIEMIRMVNSGTEATMSAIRLSRGYTNRKYILKFDGCYHGHADSLLVSSGSGTLNNGVATSLGLTEDIVANTLVCQYNDLNRVKEIFQQFGMEIACIIVEPVPGNMGVVKPKEGFLLELREICNQYGALLIFDEVITGFRVGYGTVGQQAGVTPDLITLGKIIGAGLPAGAFGGRQEIMEMISPVGGVYQAGTLSGNPMAMGLGFKLLNILKDNPDIYKELEAKAIYLETALNLMIEKYSLPVTINRYQSMISIFFTGEAVECLSDVAKCNLKNFKMFHREVFKKGILLPPSQYESWFLSAAHTNEELDQTIKVCEEAFKVVFDQ
ncbi:MAG: glutamate-1-semialdehyde 2 1-aminomutase [Fusobacteria bacterium]|nr:MAG: glutamate-1-semialdehyde 2 1-aminomutase [Fusobacteriota bacterium]KAF0230178.1 MAG: glutamate-1-semialdehyde 2 [Fusobacteriota bacterium]